MQYFYLDSNAPLRWAEAQGGNSELRVQHTTAKLLEIIGNVDNVVAASEITLGEYQNWLCVYQWDTKYPNYTAEWADRCLREFLQLIMDGRLMVLPRPSKLFDRALAYVWMSVKAGTPAGLRLWDAVHLLYAADWARTLGCKVTLVTSDPDFPPILQAFAEFGEFVEVLNPSL